MHLLPSAPMYAARGVWCVVACMHACMPSALPLALHCQHGKCRRHHRTAPHRTACHVQVWTGERASLHHHQLLQQKQGRRAAAAPQVPLVPALMLLLVLDGAGRGPAAALPPPGQLPTCPCRAAGASSSHPAARAQPTTLPAGRQALQLMRPPCSPARMRPGKVAAAR